jgi:hypothetical protein
MARQAHDRNGAYAIQGEIHVEELDNIRELQDEEVTIIDSFFQEMNGQSIGYCPNLFPGDLSVVIRYGQLIRELFGIAIKTVTYGQIVKKAL